MKSEQKNCPNCGCEVSGRNYCPDCGQANLPLRLSLKEILKEFVDDYFSLDSRLFRTLFALVFKPGVLSKEYNLGKKASYLPPLRTYLLITVLYFLLPITDTTTNISIKGMKINETTEYIPWSLGNGDTLLINYHRLKTNQLYQDSVGSQLLDSEEDWFSSSLVGKSLSKIVVNAILLGTVQEKQTAFWSVLWGSMSSIMFMLMPAFALLLLLLFRQGDLNYVNMLVFSIHLHSFVFLVLGVKYLITVLWGVSIPRIDFLIIMVYGLVAFRKVFGYSYWKTALKALLLTGSYMIFLFVGIICAALYAVCVI
jgi:hypothetical protein